MNVAVMKTKAETALTEAFERIAPDLPGNGDVGAARREAMKRFAAVGLPHRRIEEWKYTDLRNAMKEVLPLAIADDTRVTIADVIVALGPLGRIEAPRLVLVNGRFRKELSNLDGIGDATVRSLSEALAAGADASVMAGRDVDAGAGQAVVALNSAYATDGAIVDVPAGCALDAPLMLVHVRAGGDGRLCVSRNTIRVGKGARVTVLEVFAHVPGAAVEGQQSAVSVVDAADGADVTHLKVVTDAGRVTHLCAWDVTLGELTRYRGFQLTAGVGLARNDIRALYAGEGARLDLSGAFLARGSEHIDTTLVVDHASPGGESRELYKGVLDGRARGIFQGKVIVRSGAQKTDGKQMAQALMLSEDAEFDSKPELEIYADDVACGHGSTSAALDPDLLFYLRARGIPLAEARALLIQSFIGEAIDKVENEVIHDAMMEIAQAWLATQQAA